MHFLIYIERHFILTAVLIKNDKEENNCKTFCKKKKKKKN